MSKYYQYEDIVSEIELSSGAILIVHRIPPGDIELFDDAHIPPKPPLREAVAAGGVVEMVDDLEDEAYIAQKDAFDTKRQEDMRRLVFDHSELKEPPAQEVLDRLADWGIEPNNRNLIRHHMNDYLVDWLIVKEEAMRISTLTEGEVERALQRFRRRMGGGIAPTENGDTEKPVQGEPGEKS